MTRITIVDLNSECYLNAENDIRELSEQELNTKGSWLPLLIGVAILLYPTNAY